MAVSIQCLANIKLSLAELNDQISPPGSSDSSGKRYNAVLGACYCLPGNMKATRERSLASLRMPSLLIPEMIWLALARKMVLLPSSQLCDDRSKE